MLAYLAEQTIGIDAECCDCRHRVVLGFEKFLDRYGDDMLVAAPREMRG
jgi:hypothetical protein